VTRRTVRTGIIGVGRIEVLDGVAVGERVVLDPPATLADGRRVRATTAATP